MHRIEDAMIWLIPLVMLIAVIVGCYYGVTAT
jgi:hypothetical protein